MQFNVQLVVEADSVKAAANKIPDELGTVLAITPKPQTVPAQGVTRGGVVQGSQFQNTTVGKTP